MERVKVGAVYRDLSGGGKEDKHLRDWTEFRTWQDALRSLLCVIMRDDKTLENLKKKLRTYGPEGHIRIEAGWYEMEGILLPYDHYLIEVFIEPQTSLEREPVWTRWKGD